MPSLDDHQQHVVDHPGGPLLVLAGPGTGKTTTLVEAIVDRIERRGARPDEVLALTFSRKAAEQLRDRVTARLGRTMATHARARRSTPSPTAWSARYAPAELYAAPLRLLSAPEQDVVLQELLTDNPESVRWPDVAAGRASAPAASPARCTPCWPGPASAASTPTTWSRSAGPRGSPEFVAAGLFLEQYLDVLDDQAAIDYADLIARGGDRGRAPPRRAARPVRATSSSTSTRTPTPARSRCCGRSPATAAT